MIGKRWPDSPDALPSGTHVFENWPNDAVRAAYRMARAVLVPSVWAEPFGIVAIEAMSAGVPVIASATGGLVDIVDDDRTGLLVAPGSVSELVAAMRAIDADDALADRLGQRGTPRGGALHGGRGRTGDRADLRIGSRPNEGRCRVSSSSSGRERARVSIVVTNHNYGEFVLDAVDSALAQTAAVEVIVVDDGSTDDSLDVLARRASRVRLVSQPNGGQAAAFNSGWSEALR